MDNEGYVISVEYGDLIFSLLTDSVFSRVTDASPVAKWQVKRMVEDVIRFWVKKGAYVQINKIVFSDEKNTE